MLVIAFIEGYQVFDRCAGLDVMHRVEYKSATWSQIFDACNNFRCDLFRFSEGEGLLGIDGSTPENKLLAELLFNLPGIHIFGRPLKRIQDIKPRIDEFRDQGQDRPIGMDEGLPVCVSVYPVIQHFVERLEQVLVGLNRHERSILRPEIRTGQKYDLHFVAHNLKNAFQIL